MKCANNLHSGADLPGQMKRLFKQRFKFFNGKWSAEEIPLPQVATGLFQRQLLHYRLDTFGDRIFVEGIGL